MTKPTVPDADHDDRLVEKELPPSESAKHITALRCGETAAM